MLKWFREVLALLRSMDARLKHLESVIGETSQSTGSRPFLATKHEAGVVGHERVNYGR